MENVLVTDDFSILVILVKVFVVTVSFDEIVVVGNLVEAIFVVCILVVEISASKFLVVAVLPSSTEMHNIYL